MQTDLVETGLEKLDGVESVHILRYVVAIYRCVPACNASSPYDPAVVARGLGRLSTTERVAIVDYFCDLCELLDDARNHEGGEDTALAGRGGLTAR